jgi:hypothetical protein
VPVLVEYNGLVGSHTVDLSVRGGGCSLATRALHDESEEHRVLVCTDVIMLPLRTLGVEDHRHDLLACENQC